MPRIANTAVLAANEPGPVRGRTSNRTRGDRLSRASYVVFVVALAVYVMEFSTYLITSLAADYVVKVACLAVMIVIATDGAISGRGKRLLVLYGTFFALALIPNLRSAIGAVQWIKILSAFAVLPLVVATFSRQRDLSLLVKFQIPIAVALSLQSVALAWMIWVGAPPKASYIPLGRNDVMELSYGVWGYANAFISRGIDAAIRTQSWFLEPTYFAHFLEFPLFIAYGLYRTTRRSRHLVPFVACLAGLIVTASLAGFLSVISAVLFAAICGVVSRLRFARTRLARNLITGVVVVLCIGASRTVLSQLYQFYTPTATDRISMILARDPKTQPLFRDADSGILDFTLAAITDSPFGTGLERTQGNKDDMASANAFVYWLQASGWPGAIALMVVYYFLFVEIAVPALAIKGLARYASMAFIAQTVNGLSAGNWMTPCYLVTIACLVLLTEGDRAAAPSPAVSPPPNRGPARVLVRRNVFGTAS